MRLTAYNFIKEENPVGVLNPKGALDLRLRCTCGEGIRVCQTLEMKKGGSGSRPAFLRPVVFQWASADGRCLLGDLDEGDVHGVGAGFLVGGDVFADDHREGLDAGCRL